MKALVIHESVYGNTSAIADTVADALRSHALEVVAGPISQIAPEDTAEFDLLVAGGPTHAHGMSRTSTRKAGAGDQRNTFARPTLDPGLREWMDRLPDGTGRLAAAFDTRFDKPAILTGSAAKGIARRFRRLGYRLVAQPESFFVTTDNRLAEGQSDHARTWAAEIAKRGASAPSHLGTGGSATENTS
jgi:hypothetical protein